MIQRIALFAASLVAVAALVVGLATAGFRPGAATAAATAAATLAASTDPDPTAQVQVDTVYVDPPQNPATVVEHKTVPAAGGEHESEGSGD